MHSYKHMDTHNLKTWILAIKLYKDVSTVTSSLKSRELTQPYMCYFLSGFPMQALGVTVTSYLH